MSKIDFGSLIPQMDQDEIDYRLSESPELSLVIAVVQNALWDAFLPAKIKSRRVKLKGDRRLKIRTLYQYEVIDNKKRVEARKWLLGKKTGFDHYCNMLGWDINYIQKKLIHLFLTQEKRISRRTDSDH